MPLRTFFKNLNKFFSEPLPNSPTKSGIDTGEVPYPPDSYESTAWRYYEKMLEIETERVKVYSQVENCDDENDILTAVMDTYAEETTQRDPDIGKSIWVESDNKDVNNIITRMMERLDVEDKIFGMARSMVKYGDLFMKLYLQSNQGIESWMMFSPYHCVRIEKDGILKGFYLGTELPGDPKQIEPNSLPWELVHWRLFGKSVDLLYGTSILSPGLRIYRKLMMMEDHLVIYRILRAPDRFVHYLDCGDVSPDIAQRMAQKYAAQLKKDRMLDSSQDASTGVKEAYKAPAAVDDIVMPLTKGKQTRIEKLQGSSNFGDVYDIEYMMKRLLSCVRVPPGYLGFEKDGIFDSKNSLIQQDVRFARLCKKVQRAIIVGFIRLGQIELMYRNLDARDPKNSFMISMPPISYLEEAQRNTVIQSRVEIMKGLADLGSSLELSRVPWLTYVLRNFGRFSDDMVQKLIAGAGETVGGKEAGGEEPTPTERKILNRAVAKGDVPAMLESLKDLVSMSGRISVSSNEILNTSQPLPDGTQGRKISSGS